MDSGGHYTWSPHQAIVTGNKLVGGLNWEGGEVVVVLPKEGQPYRNRLFYATTIAADLIVPERYANANLVLEKGVWHVGDE